MKQIIHFGAIALVLAYAPVAVAAEWVNITTNAVGDKFFVDKSSIQQKSNLVQYWEYREFQQPNNAFLEEKLNQPLHGAVIQWSVDCTTRNQRLRQVTAYNKTKKVIRKFTYGDAGSLSQPRTGSSSNTVLNYVCAAQEPASNSPQPETK